jgi:hypothetical protein
MERPWPISTHYQTELNQQEIISEAYSELFPTYEAVLVCVLRHPADRDAVVKFWVQNSVHSDGERESMYSTKTDTDGNGVSIR